MLQVGTFHNCCLATIRLRRSPPPLRPLSGLRCCCRDAGIVSRACAWGQAAGGPLTMQHALKGDYGFNVFHNSNPQHGGSYARHERRMREDEVEDFHKSVRHWKSLKEFLAERGESDGDSAAAETQMTDTVPSSTAAAEEDAIVRVFHFDTFNDAYLFMGRLWAFCYSSDKYPNVTWNGVDITVYLYSPSFRGLSKREARVAAFLNDQYNMSRKSAVQQHRIMEGIVKTAAAEELLGSDVAVDLARRQALRTAPLQEVQQGTRSWRSAPPSTRDL